MELFIFILQMVFYGVLFALIVFLSGFVFSSAIFIKKKKKAFKVTGNTFKQRTKRRLIRTFKYLRNKRYNFKPYELSKWVMIDYLRGRVLFELFGIWCFTGYYGEGKTLGAVNFALELKRKYGYKIYTNFNMKGQDGKITCWQDLLDLPFKVIVIFDEIQSTFTSTRFKDFPIELLWKITQCRKKEMAIFASSPVYMRMSIQLRESTDYVIECNNMLGLKRWFRYVFYRAPAYEQYREDRQKLKKHSDRVYNFIAQDIDYTRYDTNQIVDRLDIEGEEGSDKKTVKGITRNEVEKIVEQKLKEWEKRRTA